VAQNFALLARQRELLATGYPLLVGWSRKSSLAALLAGSGASPQMQQRLVPSVVAAVLAVQRGASLVRVHDVRETVQAFKLLDAIK
jgi:dihydropteroate synthase